MRIPFTVTFSMCPYRDTCVISQNASAALKYMSGVGAEPSPPRLGPSSEANVMWPVPPRLTVASLRNGVTRLTSASNTISRVSIRGFNPSGSEVIDAPSGWTQLLEDFHRVGRLRPARVVRVGVGRADDAPWIDDEASRDGEPPRAVTVALSEVDAELRVDLAQIVGQGEDQAVGFGNAIAEVAQHLEGECLGLLGLARRPRDLRRDDGQARPCGGDLGQRALQSCQLRVAVWSPAAAVERQHDRAPGPELGEAHLVSADIGQREVRRRLAHLRDAAHDPRRAKLLHAPFHDRPRLCRDPCLGRLA